MSAHLQWPPVPAPNRLCFRYHTGAVITVPFKAIGASYLDVIKMHSNVADIREDARAHFFMQMLHDETERMASIKTVGNA